ncbi:hypothetical protein HQ571_02215 [Candidatus Kuenenbacteria bacterium]|nr:hypothetical protein [Candidatus Kuenenbacteria bacterium]
MNIKIAYEITSWSFIGLAMLFTFYLVCWQFEISFIKNRLPKLAVTFAIMLIFGITAETLFDKLATADSRDSFVSLQNDDCLEKYNDWQNCLRENR